MSAMSAEGLGTAEQRATARGTARPNVGPTETTRAVVAAYVQALQAGDQSALRAAFAPDATWTLPGDLPVSGTWTGPDAILDGFLAAMFARLDPTAPVTQELHRIIADGEYAVAEWTSSARSVAGREYRNDYAVTFRVTGGLIAEVTEYTDTDYLRRVLFPGSEDGPDVASPDAV